ncbi:unnamed protein product [Ilex paraguariensis]|uniref:Putative plant transposon protein domain-containing protein n=1 Tax=Ilex paraguariensis TaxID=185542 RepID=A0ABC8QYH6_9AQUA
MEIKKKRKAEGKYWPKVDIGGIGQIKSKQVGDHSNFPKPPIVVDSSSCPKPVHPSHPKQNKNVDHSSSLPNLVSSSNLNLVSSSNPNMVTSSILVNTFFNRIFFNRISEEVYHNRFCNRPVLLERGAQLDKMTTIDCALIFGLRQWNSIVEIDKNDKAYDGLVKIFYANMLDVEKEDLKFKSYMRNVHFEVNRNLISRILKVPSPFIVENIVTYPYKNPNDQPTIEDVATELYGRPFKLNIDTFYQRYLTNNYRILNRIVGCNINSRGHSANFGVDRAHLLYAIGKGIIIDLPCLIFNEIVSAFDVEGKQKSLPFPILISKIMMHYGAVIHPSDTYKSPLSPFGECTLKKSLGQTDAYDLDDYDIGASTSGDIVQMLKQILANQEELQQEMKESLKQLRVDTNESLRQLREDTKESLKQLKKKFLTQNKNE